MMFEKYGLGSANREQAAPLVAHLLVTVFLVIASAGIAGCASNSEADKAEEKVSGQPPSAEEDTPKPLPKGPKVEIGSSQADASADQATDEAAGQPTGTQPEAQSGEASPDFTRGEVDSFMKKGSAYALTQVEVKPARVDGKFQGFRLTKIDPAAADVLHPHLQVGDVITHINGVRIEKPDDYLNAWKLLGEVNKIRVDFVRDGASLHAVWHIR